MLETHRLKLVKPNLSYTDELYQLHTNKVQSILLKVFIRIVATKILLKDG